MVNTLSCQILKVLNNNVVLVKDKATLNEVILVGRGIGFGLRKYDDAEYQSERIEKSFQASDNKIKNGYMKLFEQIDKRVIGLCEEIIAEAETALGEMDVHIHLLLVDHIGFALERLSNGMNINNPFLYEIKILYSTEFEVAKKAAKKIYEHTKISIPESEIGFIALYFHSAIKSKNVIETFKDTRALRESIEIIEIGIGYSINPEDQSYLRLVNHLRAVLSRLTSQDRISNPLLDSIKEKFADSFAIARKIGVHINTVKEVDITEDELGYMAIHIERLKYLANKEGSGFNRNL